MSNLDPAYRPTTKAKQRGVLDALIDAVENNRMPKQRLLRVLRGLRRQLHNRKPQYGRVTAPATPTQRLRISQMHKIRPELSMQEISHKLKISVGRVSEVLSGKRK